MIAAKVFVDKAQRCGRRTSGVERSGGASRLTAPQRRAVDLLEALRFWRECAAEPGLDAQGGTDWSVRYVEEWQGRRICASVRPTDSRRCSVMESGEEPRVASIS